MPLVSQKMLASVRPILSTSIFDITSAMVKLPLVEFAATIDSGKASKTSMPAVKLKAICPIFTAQRLLAIILVIKKTMINNNTRPIAASTYGLMELKKDHMPPPLSVTDRFFTELVVYCFPSNFRIS